MAFIKGAMCCLLAEPHNSQVQMIDVTAALAAVTFKLVNRLFHALGKDYAKYHVTS